jgi:PAS domain S-box-containing protein
MIILHLEDSPQDAEVVRDALLRAWPECRVDHVASRPQFEAALEHGGFDVILCDYALPGFDGLAALDLAQRLAPDKPFIFISGAIGEERAIDALQRGATDYILKDRLGRLVPAIRQAVSRLEEIAQRRRADEALKRSQERFHQLAEQSSDVFWFSSADPERVIYVSPAVERIWGVSAERFCADPQAWQHSIHPDDRARAQAMFASWIEGGTAKCEHEYRVVRPDGSIAWVLDSGTTIRDSSGGIVGWSGVVKDITERRLADERLREQASLLDKARDAIIATDISHRIAYWNSSAERLFGWTSAEVFGRRLDELGLGFAPARFAEAKAQVLATGEWRGDFALRHREGADLHVESTWSLVLGNDGEPRSILIIDTDVTERKQLEMQLLRADRIDSIGMLAGGVAHDLNNALTPILMGADLLRMRATDPQDLRIIDNIEASASHGSALVKQLLAFARGSEGVRDEVRVAALFDDVRRLLRQGLPRTIEIDIAADPDVRDIHADATQMKQVLLNLSFNAREAMPQGGRLEIKCANAQVDRSLARRHPGVEPGPFLRIAIKDNGIGMPPEVVRKIFDPFFSTKRGGRGTGLGLSTVAGIVKSHGGFLTVESEVGRGTLFELFFPARGVPVAAPTRSAAPFAVKGHGETILLIDDDPHVRETFNLLLEKSGYSVVAVPDAPRAIEEFQQRGNIAAVVTELEVGGFRGVEIARALRALRPRQPIIAIGALPDAESLEALSAGTPPIEILGKPIAAETLLLALRRATASR